MRLPYYAAGMAIGRRRSRAGLSPFGLKNEAKTLKKFIFFMNKVIIFIKNSNFFIKQPTLFIKKSFS